MAAFSLDVEGPDVLVGVNIDVTSALTGAGCMGCMADATATAT